ncbi:sigma-70 family RNA polymerase sigma factor (plasmid) [Saccharothrix sp. AJ9571]|nr:sigma-70 family RNA polymerase sigma factor [Saccharothrix sp. AJ9571]
MSDTLGTGGAAAQPQSLEEAYAELYQPLCQFVRRRAEAMHGRVHLTEGAEDVVQRVFDAALTADWDTIRQPRAWLYAVARRHLHAMADWQRADFPTTSGRTVRWTSMTPVCAPEVGAAAIIAGHTLSELPNRQRQVAHLRFQERWTFAEIADALGISKATARVHVHGARELLRSAVPFQLGDGQQTTWWNSSPPPHGNDQPDHLNAPDSSAEHVHGSVRRADLISMLATLLPGVLAAGVGLLLDGTERTVLLAAAGVPVLAAAGLAARYLWIWHLWARYADWRRDRARARTQRPGPLAQLQRFLRGCYRATLFPWWRLWWLIRSRQRREQ